MTFVNFNAMSCDYVLKKHVFHASYLSIRSQVKKQIYNGLLNSPKNMPKNSICCVFKRLKKMFNNCKQNYITLKKIMGSPLVKLKISIVKCRLVKQKQDVPKKKWSKQICAW